MTRKRVNGDFASAVSNSCTVIWGDTVTQTVRTSARASRRSSQLRRNGLALAGFLRFWSFPWNICGVGMGQGLARLARNARAWPVWRPTTSEKDLSHCHGLLL